MAHGQWTEVEARGLLEAWRKSGLTLSPPVPEGPVFAELTGAPGPTVLTAVVGEAG